MQTVRLADVELEEAWSEEDESVLQRAATPLTPGTPGAREVVAEDCVVVYFELDPGKRLGTHTDSAEEILLVVDGEVTVTVGEDEGTVAAGELAVVPQAEPHDVNNPHDNPAAVIGFFPEDEVHHEAEHLLMPYEKREFIIKSDANW